MRRIALITDSTCDLPRDIVRRYCINVIPLHVVYKKTRTQMVLILHRKRFTILCPGRFPKLLCHPQARYWSCWQS